jgi:hypothetical protein
MAFLLILVKLIQNILPDMIKRFSILFSSILVISLLLVDCKEESPVKDDGKIFPDTTSHDFTFYVDTLGDGSSSVLKDIMIINDTIIFTVGGIYYKDKNNEFNADSFYNIAKWNGGEWGFYRTNHLELNAIFTSSESEIWVFTSAPYFWNGVIWQSFNIAGKFNGHVSKVWGKSSKDYYMVGTNGAIAYYNGNDWIPIPSGTTLDFKDIWGDKNPTTGEYEIYAVASKGSFSTERKIFRIQGTTATEVSTDGIPYSTNCIWFKSQTQYYVAGGGMWKKESVTSNTPWQSFESGITSYYIYGMRGQSENDIVAVGSFGELLHYNGKSWKSFRDLPGFDNLEFYAVDIKGDVICAVGYIGNRACVVRGYRNK